jgi:hypothetical protein
MGGKGDVGTKGDRGTTRTNGGRSTGPPGPTEIGQKGDQGQCRQADPAFAGPIFNSLQIGCHKKVVNLTHAHLIPIQNQFACAKIDLQFAMMEQNYKFPNYPISMKL